ncbi:MAG: TlpA disulfide reductase family protein [Pirellulales bacterium]
MLRLHSPLGRLMSPMHGRPLSSDLLLACLLLSFSACSPDTSESPAPAAPTTAAGSAAPEQGPPVELQVLDYQGIEDLIASHRGKLVVLDAWATSCPPCVKEFPNLVKLHERYGPENLACISVSFDNDGIASLDEAKATVLGFLKSQRATFDNVIGSEPSDELLKKFGIYAVPAVYVYDRQGELRKRFDNSTGEEFTYSDVEALLVRMMNEGDASQDETPAEADAASEVSSPVEQSDAPPVPVD